MALLAHGDGEEHYRWFTERIEWRCSSSYTTWLYSDNARVETKNEMERKRTELNDTERRFDGTGRSGNGKFFLIGTQGSAQKNQSEGKNTPPPRKLFTF